MPEVAHTAGVEIFRPFRDEQLLTALSTLERAPCASEISGWVGAKFHDFLHEDASELSLSRFVAHHTESETRVKQRC